MVHKIQSEVARNLEIEPGEVQDFSGASVKAGTGAQPVGRCKTCGGQGWFTTGINNGSGQIQCSDCGGTGDRTEEFRLETITITMKNPYKIGDEVKLRKDALGRHASSVPAHMGYTTNQFAWRKALGELEGKIGKVQRLFNGSKHMNVNFGGKLIGIDYTEVEPANNVSTEQLREIIKKTILEVINERRLSK